MIRNCVILENILNCRYMYLGQVRIKLIRLRIGFKSGSDRNSEILILPGLSFYLSMSSMESMSLFFFLHLNIVHRKNLFLFSLHLFIAARKNLIFDLELFLYNFNNILFQLKEKLMPLLVPVAALPIKRRQILPRRVSPAFYRKVRY